MTYYKQLKTKLKQTKGFTLIELLVVIAIIGILSSVVLASLNGARESSRDARRQTDLQQLATGLSLYANENNGNYPADLSTLESDGHISSEPVDPNTGNPYKYCENGTEYCIGADMEGDVPSSTSECGGTSGNTTYTVGGSSCSL